MGKEAPKYYHKRKCPYKVFVRGRVSVFPVFLESNQECRMVTLSLDLKICSSMQKMGKV